MESRQSQGSGRSSPSSMRSEFDVFLSFTGPDSRYSIVDHIYECMTGAGLRVFKDDEEIRRGEVIGGELKNYASSALCLRELDMKVNLAEVQTSVGKSYCQFSTRQVQAYIKLRTELYWEVLNAHKDRHGQDVMKKWEEALKTVGRISGWDSKAIQG
ncbi:hypothetical protein MLD38_036759 [Melastoma candidum]|uniref:Uncharacterized protein n=1 Tax=Melastoma candidum TaxID=119954 RepID=A0ACB9LKM3_9MYRT|nr:hypothetical protein MLD38_036759 [Melastoma candidum]